MHPMVDPQVRYINKSRRQEKPIDSMFFTAFAAELIDQPEIQQGLDPEETSTGNQN